MSQRPREAPPAPTVRTSQKLRDFVSAIRTDRVRIDEIVGALGDRGLGVLIALFAVPNIFPSTVPFGNVLTGLPVILLAVHLMLGWPHLVLPRVLARQTVAAQTLRALTPRVAGVLARVERLLKPRLLFAAAPAAERLLGVLCLFLSVISALPVPFVHMVPALGLALIGLGLIEHDGCAILLGACLGLAGVLLPAWMLFGLAAERIPWPF